MLKLGRVTKVKVPFLLYSFSILAYSKVFEFSAAILEKGLLRAFLSSGLLSRVRKVRSCKVEILIGA